MSLDWNWFFSSLSQSAAAIVGIFGAFIITKIFSNQSVYVGKKNKLRDLLVQARRISDNASTFNVEWYNNHFNKPAYRDFPDFLDESLPGCESLGELTDELLEAFIKKETFSKYSEIEGIKEKLRNIANSKFKENFRKRESAEAAFRAQEEFDKGARGGFAGIGRTVGNMARMMATETRVPFLPLKDIPWDNMRALSEDFQKNYREAKHHARLASEFLETIKDNPESPSQISWALALVLFIFFIGVIYPLSFMPAAGAPMLGYTVVLILHHILSFKGFLLGVISTAFTVIVALFFNTHAKMKYSAAEVEEIKKLTLTTNYCAHFKFLE